MIFDDDVQLSIIEKCSMDEKDMVAPLFLPLDVLDETPTDSGMYFCHVDFQFIPVMVIQCLFIGQRPNYLLFTIPAF